jgi:rhodanese-related sulfurtransferase
MRSVLASEVMEQIGIANVYNLTGGIMEWQESGMDTVN